MCGTAIVLVTQDKMVEGGLSDHSSHSNLMDSAQIFE